MKSHAALKKLTAALGHEGENIAAKYLEESGMTILSRNWKCRAGELDIVALDNDTLVFAEVKTIRKKSGFRPADNLSTRQRKRNHNAAKAYVRALNITGKSSRFDLIEITRTTFCSHLLHRKNYLPSLPPLTAAPGAKIPAKSAVISPLAKFFRFLCPGCGKFTPNGGGYLCESCLEKLQFFDPAFRCPGCGGENRGALDQCQLCLAEPPRPWQQAFALFVYQEFGKELIHRFKFGNEPELARPLGLLAADLLLERKFSADLIIPVPLNPWRLCRRGYNQAELLARVISTFTGIPFLNAMSRKLSLRSKQSSRSRGERHRGLKNIFSIRDQAAVAGKKILLVDDVLTTGATLTAAAGKLLDAQAAEVNVITLARTISSSPGIFHQNKRRNK